jgi:hypothetical protein
MNSRIILFPILALLLPFSSAVVFSQQLRQDDRVRIQPAAFHPTALSADEKKPLTRDDVNSGAFQLIRQFTGIDMLPLAVLYETSGAKDFKEFSVAFIVARNIRMDPQIVLRMLWEKSLDEILINLGLPKDQAKRALQIAKTQVEYANKEWKKGHPVQ